MAVSFEDFSKKLEKSKVPEIKSMVLASSGVRLDADSRADVLAAAYQIYLSGVGETPAPVGVSSSAVTGVPPAQSVDDDALVYEARIGGMLSHFRAGYSFTPRWQELHALTAERLAALRADPIIQLRIKR